VARRAQGSPEKATVPGAKQVFPDYTDGEMHGDVIARADEWLPGRPYWRLRPRRPAGARETLEQLRERARAENALPEVLRELDAAGDVYPVACSERCRAAAAAGDAEAAQL
jgi:nicotinate phosphoribosyltransferase